MLTEQKLADMDGSHPTDIHQWMKINVHRLVSAILIDKGMSGPNVNPILEEAQVMERSRASFNQAKKLLRRMLSYRNAEHYFSE